MDTLEIPVVYNNKELCFKAHVVRMGYVNNVVVDLDGSQITIERDEEGNYRALEDIESLQNNRVDVNLIKAIIAVLQSL